MVKKHRVTLFDERDLQEIEKSVAEAEKQTSGEIVPVVVFSSHHYGWTHGVYAALGWGIATVVVALFEHRTFGAVPFADVVFWQLVGMGLGAVLPLFPFFKRRILPSRWCAHQVHRQCLANFVALGLHETRERTGILIYLSLLERRVEILADRGIHEKVPAGYWDDQVRGLVEGIRQGRPRDALISAISEMGRKLAESFPPAENDRNELANRVRLGHSDPQ